MAANIRINGRMYSYSDLVIQVAGVALTTVTDISYEENPNFENVTGAGGEPVGYGKGNTEYTGSITIKADELRALAQAAPGKRLQNVPLFDVLVSQSRSPATNY